MANYSLRKLKKMAAGGPQPQGFRDHLDTCEQCRALFDLACAGLLATSPTRTRDAGEDDHVPFDDLMSFLGGSLTDKRRDRVLAHLAQCDSCRSELAELANAAADLDQGLHVQAAASRTRKARELWSRAGTDAAPSRKRNRVSGKNPMTVCIIADDSKSMAGDPACEVTQSIRDFLVMLQAACQGRRSYFQVLLLKFGDFPHVIHDFAPVLDIDPDEIELTGQSGGTDMGAALELACQKLSNGGAALPGVPPLVLFCSDGANSGADPLPWAERIKSLESESGEGPFFVTCGFGEVDKPLLQQIATSPDHFKDLRSPFELRQFLAEIGSTVTSLATEGQTPTTVHGRILALIGKAAA